MSVETFDFTPQPLPARSDLVDEGDYLCRLKSISDKRHVESRFGEGMVWEQDFVFEIIEGKFKGKELAYTVNPSINMGYLEGAKKSRLYNLLKVLTGIAPEKLGKFTSQQLLGRTALLEVEQKTSMAGNQYVRITEISKDRNQAPLGAGDGGDEPPIEKPKAKTPPKEDSDDF